jgi:hypothetical protein
VRASAHTAGFSDELGARQLKFDHAAGASLEVLRIRQEFADSPSFEAALRTRVDEMRNVQHPSLATIHGVERRDGEGLCLVSRLTSGRRISELAPKAQGPTFALELLRLVTPALAMLHRGGLVHGAVSADRIVVTRDGRLVLVDHVFGPAIESLNLSRTQLIELGLVVPLGDGPFKFDGRTDMAQLGFIALSLLLGRPLEPADYPEHVPALLDEFVRGAGSPIVSGKLRGWLERAMQISPRPFASAREAQDALGELPDDKDVQIAAVGAMPPVRKPAVEPVKPVAGPVRERATPVAAPTPAPKPAPIPRPAEPLFVPVEDSIAEMGTSKRWLAPALAVLAGVEAVVIGVLLFTRPAAPASTSAPATVAQTAAAAPATLPVSTPPAPVQTPAATPATTPAASTPAKSDFATAAAAVPAAPPPPVSPPAPRVGTVTVTSPIALQVFENDAPVGPADSPLTLSEGSHTLEFVNEETGFRLKQNVSVKNGKATPVTIGVPNGRVSINAVPWAEVTIDGNPAGETPIANLSLPIGTHEIVFKHPQLGERRQTVIIKVDGITRVTQTLQPGLSR